MRLQVNADEVIPKEVKTLTAGGKVSIKPMPKARFHERAAPAAGGRERLS